MGLTRDYLRYSYSGTCNLTGSNNGMVSNVNKITCATIAGESVNFYNMRTREIEKSFRRDKTSSRVTIFKLNKLNSILAIGFDDGEIHLHKFGFNQDEVPEVLVGHKRTRINALAFDSSGLILASGGEDCSIVLWDILNGSGMFKLSGHKGPITHLCITRDNRYVISSSKDSQVKFWSIDSKSCFYTLSESITEIYSFALVNEDRLLVIASAEIELLLFDLTWIEDQSKNGDQFQNDQVDSECPPKRQTQALLVGADYIEESSDQANTILRCRKRGTLMRQAKGRAMQLSVSSDESILCCVSSDSLMDLYRIYNEEESLKRFKKKLRRSRERITADQDQNDHQPSHDVEATIARDVTILISRIGEFRANAKIKWADFCESYSASKTDSREYRMYCLLKSNDVHGLAIDIDWKTNQMEAKSIVSLDQRGHRTDIRTLSISSNGSTFLSGAQESAIIWDSSTLLPLNKFEAKEMQVISASLFLPGDRHVLLCTMDGSMFLFEVANNLLIESHKNVHEGSIFSAVEVPHKNEILTCGSDKKVRIWNLQQRMNNSSEADTNILTLKRILELPDEPLGAAISPNGKFAVFALLDNTARIYYIDSLKFFVSLYGHSLPVYCVDISPDNKLVVTGSGDKTAKIWGLDFGDCHRSLFAHDNAVSCVKFGRTTEERLFWTAGKDGMLKQWDATKFSLVQVLHAHTDAIRAIIVDPFTDMLISAANDRSIRVWELTDEIIVLQEEEEKEREKEHEQKLVELEDISKTSGGTETDLAPIKTIESIKSTESIIDALELIHKERLERELDPKHMPHPLLASYPPNFEHLFLADVIQKIGPSHLERSLLLLPLSYIQEILKSLCRCVKEGHKQELACRVILFLVKVHHNQIKNSIEFFHLIDELRTVLSSSIDDLLNCTGFNLQALRFLQISLEERTKVKLFQDASKVEKDTKKRGKGGKAKDFTLVTT